MRSARAKPVCSFCGKPAVLHRCPGCGRPRAEQAERLRKYLLRVFSADATAHATILDGFAALLRPEAEGGGGAANELEALLCAFRECVATYGGGA